MSSGSHSSSDVQDRRTSKDVRIANLESIAEDRYGEVDDTPYDVDDPRLEGKLQVMTRGDYDRKGASANTLGPLSYRQHCLLRLGKALIKFGAAGHRCPGIMTAAQIALEVREVKFIFFPGIMEAAFGTEEYGNTELKLVRASTRLDLGRLGETHRIYKAITRREITAEDAANRLGAMLDPATPAFYGKWQRCCFGFCCSLLVSGIAYAGSILDMSVAGSLGFFVNVLNLFAAERSAVFGQVFMIVAATLVSFIAQGLASIRNETLFCQSAIAIPAIVSLLPGFTILSSIQELVSKLPLSGSIRTVAALVQSLFLGFALDLGSTIYLTIDKPERRLYQSAMKALTPANILKGVFVIQSQDSPFPWRDGSFVYTPAGVPISASDNHFMTGTCSRTPDAPWYIQSRPWWTLFFLVPLYAFFSSLWNLQPVGRTWKVNRPLLAMISISCASFAANWEANKYVGRSSSVTTVGAFVVGLLGNLYARRYGGEAYPVMVPGVLFLVPAGISSPGAASYGSNDFTVRILQVSVGISVGFGFANYLVYLIFLILPTRLGGRRSSKEAVFVF